MSAKMSRRDFLNLLAASTGGVVLVACSRGPDTIEVVVTATPGPTSVPEAVGDVMGTFPRRETLIVRGLTGRVGTPDNMNLWVGWKWQDRGLQNLADEPMWSGSYANDLPRQS